MDASTETASEGYASVCLACGGADLRVALNLARQPPANLLLSDANQDYPSFPLALNYCANCGHGQQAYFAAPGNLFNHYLYASGTSGTLAAYFDWFSEEVSRLSNQPLDILEIACNDGSLLRRLAKAGHTTLGVDPAANLAADARRSGLEVITDFWPCPNALKGRRFDLVVAMNVLAHTPDPVGFLRGVADVLAQDGLCIVQTSQAGMLVNGEFDTIYHEHYSFFTPNSMGVLVNRAGLEIKAVRLVAIHGTSFTFVLGKTGGSRNLDRFLASGRFAVAVGSGEERAADAVTGSPSQYIAFAASATDRMKRVREIVAHRRAEGRKICLVGAAAKAMTFLHAAPLDADAVFDEAPLKIGRFIPGTGLPIQAMERIADIAEPILAILSAWNFRDELTRKVRQRLPDRDISFLVYFPDVVEFS